MNTKQFLAIINIVALIASSIGCKTKAEEKTIKPVKVKAVATHTGTNVMHYSASIRPSSQVEISFKVGGYVEVIKSVEGRHIQAEEKTAKPVKVKAVATHTGTNVMHYSASIRPS